MKETPSQLKVPSYVLNFPFTLSTEDPNNIWMQELSPEDRNVNKPKAYKQFMDLYNFVAGGSLVYLIPSYAYKPYQDQVYVANVGIHLSHVLDDNIILLSNFTSEPRQGEELIAKPFFDAMNYSTHLCPHKWEGEADLKYIGGNNYIGGYGQRSEKASYDWMVKHFNMNIIQVDMVESYLYHLDCSIFPLTNEKTLVCTELYLPEEIAEIEKITQIVDINIDDAFGGITNSVRMGNMILCASNIAELKRPDPLYELEKNKINTLEKICANEGLEPVIFNLSEYMKSGAMLSCLFMHLSRHDYTKSVI